MEIKTIDFRIPFSILLLLLTANSFSQDPQFEWARSFGTVGWEVVEQLAVDKGTNEVCVVGTWTEDLSGTFPGGTNPSTQFESTYGWDDGFVAKYDQNGNLLWAFKVGGEGDDEIFSVAIDRDGNIYITGMMNPGTNIYFSGNSPHTGSSTLSNSSDKDFFLAKYNPNGEFIWVRRSETNSGNLSGSDVTVNSDAVFAVGAYDGKATFGSESLSKHNSGNDIFLVKYSLDGDEQWVTEAGSNGDDIATEVVADESSVFYTGKFDGSNLSIGNVDGGTSASKNNVVNGTDEIILVSYNLDGNANWSQTISSIADDMGQGMTLDADSIYLTGEVDNGVSFPGYAGNPLSTSAKRDIFISSHAKSDGITGWVHIIPCTGDSDERGFCLDADNFGNLYVIGDYKDDLQFPDGVTLTAISGDDVFVAGYTTDGDFGWAESAGSSQKDEGYGLAVGLEGSLYICGRHDNQMGLGSLTLPDNDSWNGFLAKLQGLIPPPANDNPCSAILLPVGDTCASEIDDNIGATDSGIPDPGCGEYRDGDVWFKAVIPPSGNLFIGTDASDDDSYPPVDGWMYRVEMAVYSGTCGSLNMEGCYSHNSGYHYRASSAYLFDKNPGDTIWIRVWEAFGDDFGNFSICTFDPGHFPAWDIPEMLCSNEGMIDLDTTLAELITGFVDGVTGSSGVPDPDDAVSTPDAATARLFDDGDWITLDLTDTIPAGEPYIIYFRSNTSVDDPTQMTLRASQNSVDFIEHSFKPETELDAVTSYYIIAEHPTRYIYIGNHGAGGGGFAVDGIKYFYRGTMGGTWSGPGVTGSIFDPSALLGAVSITYSLGGTTTDSDSTITTQIMKSDAGTLGNDTTICTGDHSVTLDLQGFNGSVIKWESSEDGFLSTNPIANTDPSNIVSGLLQTTSFRVIVQDGSCDPDTSNAVIVTVAEIPSANPGSYSDVCGANLGLQAIPSVGSGAWSTASGPGSATFTPSENNPTVSVEIDQYGTYLFTWTETNGNCTDDSTISVTFHEEPVADPGSGGDTCSTRFDLNAIPSVGVGQWSKISGPGSVFFTPSNAAPDAVASVSINGSYLFQWSETNAGCTSDANILVNYSKPPAVDPGPDDQTCGLDFTLNAVPSFGSGTWTLYTGPGTAQFSPSETAENATVSVTETGSYEFLWTESDGMCSNDSVISVAFIDIPVSNAGSGGEWCGPEYQLSALPATGTGSWTHTGGPGTATFNPSPDLPDATVSASEPGKYEFTWTETNGICSDQDRIEVLFTDEMVVDAGTGRFTCGLQSDLVAFPADLTGHWSKFSGPGMVTYSPHDSATIASVTVDEFGLYVFQWEVIRGFCSGWDTVAIEFFNQPEADAGTDQILEFDFSTYLNAVSPELGYGTWSVLHGTGDIEHFNDPVSRVTGLELGLNEFIWTISSELCPDASDQVIVTVNDIQTSTVITPNMDGQNDFLVFPGVESLSGSEIIIYNRWGTEVYRSNDYKNDWDGKDHKGRELVMGTYFYILKIPPDRVIKSFVEIRKE